MVPSVAITASTPDDMGPFFDPGNDKAYRHPQFYKAPRGVRVFNPEFDNLMTTPALFPLSASAFADDRLVLGHRLSEWCGHGPILEEDTALANIALDLVIGEATLLPTNSPATSRRSRRNEDALAYLRDAVDFRNMH